MGLPQRKAKNKIPATPPETVRGIIARCRFHNPGNGYCVIQVDTNGEFVNMVGYMPSVRQGDEFSFTGRWSVHPKFGRQFTFDSYELLLPKSRHGIVAYLAELAYGVGEVKAGRIVDALGEDCLETIRDNPTALYCVPGITLEQADEIVAKINENTILADLSSMICRHGITPRLAARIYAQYGAKSIEVVTDNPYVLADEMYRVGFVTADQIAQSVGVAPDSPYRVQAALEFVLKNASEMAGHCYLRPRDIVPAVQKVLGKGCGVGVDQIAAANKALDETGKTIREGHCVYLAGMHRAEVRLASRMRALLAQKVKEIPDIDNLIDKVEKRL